MALSSRSADPVDSVEDLRTAIESAKQRMEEEQARERTLTAEVDQANERQRLRRELDKHSKALLDQRRKNAMHEQKRRWVDTDQFGPHLPEGLPIRPKSTKSQHQESCGESIDFGNLVSSFEYVWRLEHLSWLRAWLRQEDMDGVWSQVFRVADGEFDFGYNPDGGTAEDEQNGTLVIRCWGSRIAFRYRIFVKARCGKFVQWGETRDEFQEWKEEYESWEYGPDVHEPGSRPSSLTSMGIFGLSHQQLLRSDWVDNDTLTVKFMLEVRPQGDAYSASSYTQLLKTTVNVPGPTMGSDMLRFLEKSAGSDVEFVVQGERIKAHSQVLCARSEVFEKQLTTGMKESVSKMITIEDCDPASFKTLLHYLYTDDLGCIDELLSKAHGDGGSFSGTQLQALLAVSHKYDVTRLRLCCERELAKHISLPDVCAMLCEAHLLQAKELESACLTFIKEHVADVLKLPAYAELLKRWPEIGLRVGLFSAGVPEAEAAKAMETFKGAAATGKRKRSETEENTG